MLLLRGARKRLWVAWSISGALVQAYIPAQPSNDTSGQTIGGLAPNQTDTSEIYLNWFPSKTTSEQISYQLIGNNSNGLSEGALVHFSEFNLTNAPDEMSLTPWIAFVACDANATNASQDNDIFTLAADRGAIAALLYSQYSNSCIINPEYADPANFNRLFDIFSTKKLVDAQLIESQYTNIDVTYSDFNASLLNGSLAAVEQSLSGGPTIQGYLIAILQAANATASPNSTNPNPRGGNRNQDKQNPNTGLAMIILYAITGCVSALFCVVILSGAIRAIRHPERYGPRPDDPTMGPGRSRTAGLGRAILDTFPIIKFGATESAPSNVAPRTVSKRVSNDERSNPSVGSPAMIELDERMHLPGETALHDGRESEDLEAGGSVRNGMQGRQRRGSTSYSLSASEAVGSTSTSPVEGHNDVTAEMIGHETCPICILDFEEGDDLRVLPCEGKHRFHQACVDPWLLEMSSSCPLCREDFWTLESMVQGNNPEGSSTSSPSSSRRPGLVATPHTETSSPVSSRRLHLSLKSSKYLRFAQKRRNRNQAVRNEES